MPNIEIDLNPVDFITVGTIGPKGQRVFHLQAGKAKQIVSLIIEKEQAWALSEAIRELVEDLEQRYPGAEPINDAELNMELRDPIEPLFRVAQMGLGYDEDRNMVVLVAQELVSVDEEEDDPKLKPCSPVLFGCGAAAVRCAPSVLMPLRPCKLDALTPNRTDA